MAIEDDLDNLLDPQVESIKLQLEPYIDRMLSMVDQLVAAGEEITADDLEEPAALLNQGVETVLGRELRSQQPLIRDVAVRWGEVGSPPPALGGGQLLALVQMDGVSFADWLERKSPSRWMKGIMAALQEGIDAGWERHRAATRQSVERLTEIAAETAVWAGANFQLQRQWTAKEFTWRTREDELVCPKCGPKNNTRFRGVSNGPPAHPRCRCTAIPAN